MPRTITKTVTAQPHTDPYVWQDVNGVDGTWVNLTETSNNTWDFVVDDNNTGSDRSATFILQHSTYGTAPANPALSKSFTIVQHAEANNSVSM